jgi:hypothetical protein
MTMRRVSGSISHCTNDARYTHRYYSFLVTYFALINTRRLVFSMSIKYMGCPLLLRLPTSTEEMVEGKRETRSRD